MPEHHKKKQFLKLPKYPGGTAAFREFVSQNLRYPEEALEKGIEGSVLVEYEIRDDGTVHNAHVLNGIGHGCDEEALRVVQLLQFEKVRNRGVRVKMTTKTTLHFKLPAGTRISYTVSKVETPAEEKKPENPTYSYTISF